jgi:hypothetical protein
MSKTASGAIRLDNNMKYWVHLEAGIVKGLMRADGSVGRDELARELGEWVLTGITPVLLDFDFIDPLAKCQPNDLRTAR